MTFTIKIKKVYEERSERVKSIDLHPTKPWALLGLYSGKVSIWNYNSQTTEKSFEVAKSPVRTTKFIAHKEWIIAGADDGFIRVYNYNTTESVVELEAHSDYLRSLAVHPSLPYVLSASDDKLIKLWDWEKGWKCTKTFQGHEHYVMKVAFNPKDTNVFASVSLDCTIKYWNLGAVDPSLSIQAHSKGVNWVEFFDTNDEKLYLITGSDDHTSKVWEYDTATSVETLEGHTNNVTSIQYVHPGSISSSNSYIITGSEDGTVSVWNAETYKVDHVFTSDLGRVWTIGFIEDSSQVLLGCDEGMIMGEVISSTRS